MYSYADYARVSASYVSNILPFWHQLELYVYIFVYLSSSADKKIGRDNPKARG